MTDASRAADHPWWKRGVFYQVYPRSFMDANGDGVGDLAGIERRLDYLRWLGVDGVWVSPFYPSPMADFGYDVTDHRDVDPLFGTMADFDAMLRRAHALDLRLILDFIPNHTSDRHPWFVDSRTSRDAPHHDWYLWCDGRDGAPPNNWQSTFGGPAWTWEEATRQFYYHAFLPQQPDLNWRNPAVEREMFGVMRFWLDRGVDGFRVDAVQNVIKDEKLRDNPPNPDYRDGDDPFTRLLRTYSGDRPEVYALIERMRALVDGYGGERVLLGEVYNSVEKLMAYYGHEGRGCNFPYNFQLIRLPWDARAIDEAVREYEALLPPGAWPNWVLGNHDRHRVASRVGAAQARVAAMLLLTLRGTPTLYYGDEIGMTNVVIPPEREQDPWGKRVPGKGLGRDPERTPMQWDGGPGAGFTTGEPWLPISPDAPRVNVEAQRDDPNALLTLYRRLISLRREEPALAVGAWEPVEAEGEVLAYLRHEGEDRFLVVLNLGACPTSLDAREASDGGTVVLGTRRGREGETVRGRVDLAGDEGVVVRLA